LNTPFFPPSPFPHFPPPSLRNCCPPILNWRLLAFSFSHPLGSQSAEFLIPFLSPLSPLFSPLSPFSRKSPSSQPLAVSRKSSLNPAPSFPGPPFPPPSVSLTLIKLQPYLTPVFFPHPLFSPCDLVAPPFSGFAPSLLFHRF